MNARLAGSWVGVARSRAGRLPELGFRFPWWLWLVYSVMLAAIAAVGATSFWMEADGGAGAVPLWPIAVDEVTSVITVFVLTPLLVAWTARLDPERIGWVRTLMGHLVGMLAFGVLHVSGMTMLRLLASLFAEAYSIGSEPLLVTLVYEGRKDALTYAGLVVGSWLLSAALRKEAGVAQPVAETPRIEIRDGTRRICSIRPKSFGLRPPEITSSRICRKKPSCGGRPCRRSSANWPAWTSCASIARGW
jgi:hypothetical protein